MAIETTEIIKHLVLGGLIGATGQGLRVVIGIKKLNDEAKKEEKKTSDLIVTSRLLISLLIGFCAGILTMLSITTFTNEMWKDVTTTRNTILSLFAAGYAGTDAIEGLINKYLPKQRTTNDAASRKGNVEEVVR